MSGAADRILVHWTWRRHLVFGLLFLVLVYSPVPYTVSSLLYISFGLSAAAAVLLATHVRRPAARGAWYLLAGGIGLFTAGDIAWAVYEQGFGITAPFPSVADLLYLGGYPVMALALVGFARQRNWGSDGGTKIDATIIGVAYAVAAWLCFVAPYVRDPEYPWFDRLVSAAYPALNVLVVGAAAYLVLAPGPRVPAFVALVGASLLYIAADIAYVQSLLTGTYEDGSILQAVWMLAAIGWAITALHPSMPELARVAPAQATTLTLRRLLALAAAAIAMPSAQLIPAARDQVSDTVVVVSATGLIFFLVVLRLGGLTRAIDRGQRYFRALVEHGGELIAVVGPDSMIRSASPSYASILGYDPETLVNRPGLALVDPNHQDAVAAMFADLVENHGEQMTIQLDVLHADGSLRVLEATVSNLLHDPDVRGLIVNARDITGRTRAEQALRATQALTSSVIDSSNDGIFAFDADRRATVWNPAMERTTGVSQEQVLGQDLVDLFPFLRETGEADLIAAALRGESAVATPQPNRLPETGQAGTYETRYAPLRDATGGIIGGVGIVRDVTGRARAEAALRAAARDYRQLFELASDAILIVDPDFEIVLDANQRACVLYGFPREHFIGRSLVPLSVQPALANRQIETLRSEGDRVSFETVHRRADGTPMTLAVNASRIDFKGSPAILSINRDVTAQKALEAELAHRAFHDVLTGLPNRALFLDRLDHALRVAGTRGECVAVLMLDLDRFKLVNDSLGHAAGDRLLVAVGQRLASCLRATDTLARLGGDEFAVLLENAPGPVAREMAERLLASLSAPVLVEGREVYTGTSIGIALSRPDWSRSAELLRAADIALYRAKRAGRGTLLVFDPEAADATVDWLILEAELRRAVERGMLELHYQPILRLADGAVTAVEALLRWRHPVRGMLYPAEFVPMAEESGLITKITAWVLTEACRQFAVWRQAFGRHAPPRININVTGRDLREPDFAGRVQAALAQAGLPASALCLELSEGVLIEELHAAAGTLATLRKLGIILAIDDFGAGASSLASLRAVEATMLKLDRAFVRGMETNEDDRIVVAAIAAMAHALGMRVTAEGLETDDQIAAVRAAGCDDGQGYHFARPIPPDELEGWLEGWRIGQRVEADQVIALAAGH